MRRVVALAIVVLATGCGGPASTRTPVDFVPPVECIGIPAETCQQIVRDARANADPGTFPVRIRAVCSQVPCTPQRGDVSVDIEYSNGRRDSYGMGWAGGIGADPEPPPEAVVLPVEPTCLGVPPGPCRERALETVGANGDTADIVAIVVRCTPNATTRACTELAGAGQTVLTFADGSTQTADWGYMDGG